MTPIEQAQKNIAIAQNTIAIAKETIATAQLSMTSAQQQLAAAEAQLKEATKPKELPWIEFGGDKLKMAYRAKGDGSTPPTFFEMKVLRQGVPRGGNLLYSNRIKIYSHSSPAWTSFGNPNTLYVRGVTSSRDNDIFDIPAGVLANIVLDVTEYNAQ